jgi:hypothetical protein
MKLFHFQNGGNTRFVWQENPHNDFDSTLEVANDFRDKIKTELGNLNKEIFMTPGTTPADTEQSPLHTKLLQGEKVTLSTGWEVRFSNGTISMDRTIKADKEAGTERLKESITRHKDGRLIYKRKEGRDPWQKIKTYDNPNLKKAKNEDVKLKWRDDEDNSLRKVKDREENNVVTFTPEGEVDKVRRDFDPEVTNPKIEAFAEEAVENLQQATEDALELDLIDTQIETLRKNYTIKPGDTISDIVSFCKNENGESPSWKTVYEANKDNLRSGDPNLIFPGEKIKLPDGYTLDDAALSSAQLENLKDWYGEKKALEVRMQYKPSVASEPETIPSVVPQRQVYGVQPGDPEYIAPSNTAIPANTSNEQIVQPGEKPPLENKLDTIPVYQNESGDNIDENAQGEYANFELPKIHENYTERDRVEIKQFHKEYTIHVRVEQVDFAKSTKELADAKNAYDIAKAKYDAIDPNDRGNRMLASPKPAEMIYNGAKRRLETRQHALKRRIDSLERFNRNVSEGTMANGGVLSLNNHFYEFEKKSTEKSIDNHGKEIMALFSKPNAEKIFLKVLESPEYNTFIKSPNGKSFNAKMGKELNDYINSSNGEAYRQRLSSDPQILEQIKNIKIAYENRPEEFKNLTEQEFFGLSKEGKTFIATIVKLPEYQSMMSHIFSTPRFQNAIKEMLSDPNMAKAFENIGKLGS